MNLILVKTVIVPLSVQAHTAALLYCMDYMLTVTTTTTCTYGSASCLPTHIEVDLWHLFLSHRGLSCVFLSYLTDI